MAKIPREVRKGVWYVGKDNGSNAYFYTLSTMGTAGEKRGHMNYLGEIRTGRIDNPGGISSISYALGKESHYTKYVRDNIRKVIKILRG